MAILGPSIGRTSSWEAVEQAVRAEAARDHLTVWTAGPGRFKLESPDVPAITIEASPRSGTSPAITLTGDWTGRAWDITEAAQLAAGLLAATEIARIVRCGPSLP